MRVTSQPASPCVCSLVLRSHRVVPERALTRGCSGRTAGLGSCVLHVGRLASEVLASRQQDALCISMASSAVFQSELCISWGGQDSAVSVSPCQAADAGRASWAEHAERTPWAKHVCQSVCHLQRFICLLCFYSNLSIWLFWE